MLQRLGCRPPSPQQNPGEAPLYVKLLYLDPPNDLPGIDAHCCVSGSGFKPSTIPHDSDDLRLLLKLPPYRRTCSTATLRKATIPFYRGDVFVRVERLEVENKLSPTHAQPGRNHNGFLQNVLETPPETSRQQGMDSRHSPWHVRQHWSLLAYLANIGRPIDCSIARRCHPTPNCSPLGQSFYTLGLRIHRSPNLESPIHRQHFSSSELKAAVNL